MLWRISLQCHALFQVNVLKAHMLTHSDTRDYPCTWEGCSYAFKTKGSLKRHMRRHTGERPFRCELCGRCFGESGALTRHLKSRYSRVLLFQTPFFHGILPAFMFEFLLLYDSWYQKRYLVSWMTMLFSVFAIHCQVISSMGCQPGDCRWPL